MTLLIEIQKAESLALILSTGRAIPGNLQSSNEFKLIRQQILERNFSEALKSLRNLREELRLLTPVRELFELCHSIETSISFEGTILEQIEKKGEKLLQLLRIENAVAESLPFAESLSNTLERFRETQNTKETLCHLRTIELGMRPFFVDDVRLQMRSLIWLFESFLNQDRKESLSDFFQSCIRQLEQLKSSTVDGHFFQHWRDLNFRMMEALSTEELKYREASSAQGNQVHAHH